MTASTAIALLQRAVSEPGCLAERIRLFQETVFQDESLDGPVESVLRDLAYDLDFYEPDPRVRGEDPAFFDDARAVDEIRSALQRIRDLPEP